MSSLSFIITRYMICRSRWEGPVGGGNVQLAAGRSSWRQECPVGGGKVLLEVGMGAIKPFGLFCGDNGTSLIPSHNRIPTSMLLNTNQIGMMKISGRWSTNQLVFEGFSDEEVFLTDISYSCIYIDPLFDIPTIQSFIRGYWHIFAIT